MSDNYYDKPFLSNTGLGYLARSALHYKAFLAGDITSTKAMEMGRLLHAAILEPHLLPGTWAIKADGRTNVGKEINAANAGKILITKDEYETFQGIVHALNKDEFVTSLLCDALVEHEIYFDYRGVKCKAKLDCIKPGAHLVDFKFMLDAEPKAFIRKSGAYNYDRQIAWYQLAAKSDGLITDETPCYLIAVEKSKPFAYSVIEVTESVIKAGQAKYDKLVDKYLDTVHKGLFPGYPSEKWESDFTIHPGQPLFPAVNAVLDEADLEQFLKIA